MRTDCAGSPENVQIAVARASAVSHARDVDVCPVRLEVLLHPSLGIGVEELALARAIAKTTFFSVEADGTAPRI